MNILITGATGFIGKTLCHTLLAQNHSLITLTRNPDKATHLLGDSILPIVHLDGLDRSQKIDAVINLAGEPIADKRWSKEQKKRIEQSRIDLTAELIAFLRNLQQPPEVLISGSAIGYYGDCGDRELSEHSEAHDEFSHRLCAAWESQALRAKAYDIRVAIVRTGLVVGKNGGFLKKMLPSFKMGLGAQLGSGEQWMSWIHIEDYINIILFLLNNKTQNGIYNATAPQPVTNQVFSDTLASVLKRPRLLTVPAPVLKFLLGEMSHLLLTGQRVLPKRLQDQGFTFQYSELRRALEEVCRN